MPRPDGCRIFTGEGCLCWRSSCLYDVEADPGETRDMVAQRPEVAARLLRRLATVSAAAPAERAALCGAERKQDERVRRESVERQDAYLPYGHDVAWRNDPSTPACVHLPSREVRDFYVRAGVSVVGESPFWEVGMVSEYELPVYNLSSVRLQSLITLDYFRSGDLSGISPRLSACSSMLIIFRVVAGDQKAGVTEKSRRDVRRRVPAVGNAARREACA